MHYFLNVHRGIAPLLEKGGDFLKVSDRIQISGTLFFSKSPIQIRTNSNVVSIPCKLTDMIHVV